MTEPTEKKISSPTTHGEADSSESLPALDAYNLEEYYDEPPTVYEYDPDTVPIISKDVKKEIEDIIAEADARGEGDDTIQATIDKKLEGLGVDSFVQDGVLVTRVSDGDKEPELVAMVVEAHDFGTYLINVDLVPSDNGESSETPTTTEADEASDELDVENQEQKEQQDHEEMMELAEGVEIIDSELDDLGNMLRSNDEARTAQLGNPNSAMGRLIDNTEMLLNRLRSGDRIHPQDLSRLEEVLNGSDGVPGTLMQEGERIHQENARISTITEAVDSYKAEVSESAGLDEEDKESVLQTLKSAQGSLEQLMTDAKMAEHYRGLAHDAMQQIHRAIQEGSMDSQGMEAYLSSVHQSLGQLKESIDQIMTIRSKHDDAMGYARKYMSNIKETLAV